MGGYKDMTSEAKGFQPSLSGQLGQSLRDELKTYTGGGIDVYNRSSLT